MSDAAELAALLARRRADGADLAAIDAAITARFGRTLAVMFTDLVGFSRAVEAFGIVHFLQLIDEAEALFLPLAAQHGGRCVKREGDSLLLVFAEPADALACARAMVAATVAVNPTRQPETRIEVCIGLGYGTMLCIDDGELWGAELNAASKLGEEIAHGGEILATGPFRDALPQHRFEPHGELFGRRPAYRYREADGSA
ncbi:adenylate/guanylate cyclase domain-containing protein [Chitinimonas koreensis]|uniref:adenylate/guanylate cyclase domain-containing protein n=1 Tax=Chitinimonas koreensis TaxID=356302 RepID=UPI0004289D27|nr:adenylate/guanylate cyclase domain-containing protein [Chitinimonas koreensis]QNM94702.1 adenylate/guanylate cyclase domain-containing protein [Chitinimonas koreensis]